MVGGGNSAGQAAVFLAEGSQVYLLVRGDDLGENMSRYLVDRIERHPRVEVMMCTEVRDVVGDKTLEAVVVENNRNGERRELAARALFVFIGATPHTTWLSDTVALDVDGFVLTGTDADEFRAENVWRHISRPPLVLETSRPGVFAVGDVRRGSTKRMASAVGEGPWQFGSCTSIFQNRPDVAGRIERARRPYVKLFRRPSFGDGPLGWLVEFLGLRLLDLGQRCRGDIGVAVADLERKAVEQAGVGGRAFRPPRSCR